MRSALIIVRAWLFAAALVVILCVVTEDEGRTAVTAPPGPVLAQASVTSAPLLIPVLGVTPDRLRDSFNEHRSGSRSHCAIDILAPRGTPVLAAVDGVVQKLFRSGAGGLTVYEFDAAREKVYYYAHLDAYASTLHEGLTVHRGDLLGYVGTTGNAPPGTPHLHFAIGLLTPAKLWWKSAPLNPYPLLAEHGSSVTTPASARR